jgi:hypothetical protein
MVEQGIRIDRFRIVNGNGTLFYFFQGNFGQDSLRGLTLAVSIAPAGKWPVVVKNIGDPN